MISSFQCYFLRLNSIRRLQAFLLVLDEWLEVRGFLYNARFSCAARAEKRKDLTELS